MAERDQFQLGKAFWAKARLEYVTGNESQSQIADRLEVARNTVAEHASPRHPDNKGVGWHDARQCYLQRSIDAVESATVAPAYVTIENLKQLERRLNARIDQLLNAIGAQCSPTAGVSGLPSEESRV